MRSSFLYFCYLMGCLILAAIVLPWWHMAAELFTEARPHKILTRLGLVLAAIGFWWLIRYQGLNSKAALGLPRSRKTFWSQCLIGMLAGFLIMSAVMMVLAQLDILSWRQNPHISALLILKILFSGLLTGLIVGLIEETFFRGAMQSAVARRSLTLSIITPSVLYAFLHFIKAEPWPADATLNSLSGLEILASSFHRFNDPLIIGPFLALTMAGIFLALIRVRSGSLAWCIGIHAGWVCSIKLTKKTTDIDSNNPMIWVSNGYDGYTSYLAAFWLLLLCLPMVYGLLKQPKA